MTSREETFRNVLDSAFRRKWEFHKPGFVRTFLCGVSDQAEIDQYLDIWTGAARTPATYADGFGRYVSVIRGVFAPVYFERVEVFQRWPYTPNFMSVTRDNVTSAVTLRLLVDQFEYYQPGDSIMIPPGLIHRLEASAGAVVQTTLREGSRFPFRQYWPVGTSLHSYTVRAATDAEVFDAIRAALVENNSANFER